MSETTFRYCLAENDKAIIKQHIGDKKLSSNAEKSLIILSEAFGGLHHLDHDQLELFDYESRFYNFYLLHGSLSTWDNMILTSLVIMAHDMAVRFEIQAHELNSDDDYKLLEKQLEEYNSDYDTHEELEEFAHHTRTYIKLLFHERQREGDFSTRHPTLEDSMKGFRDNNKRYH
jgi:hypothetical protein